MSLLTKKLTQESTADIDYNPTVKKWIEARIIGVADLGEQDNPFQPGKKVSKCSILFALDEELVEGVLKTKVEKFTASLHEKSGLMTKLLEPACLDDIESLDQLIGKNLKIKFATSDCGKYCNIKGVDESETPLPPTEGIYIPKFWLVNKEGNPTGYDYLLDDGVIDALREDAATTVDSSEPV